jgi:hypothetical protein
MPLQLSGQVCLPADAEAEIAALTAIHQREILAKNKLIDRLLKSIDNLNNLKRPPKRRVRRAPNGRENG